MSTLKQQAVAKDLIENKGKSVSQAMVDAGYDPRTARNPQQLTRSKGWQELMEKYLPDKTLLKVHKQGLGAIRKRAEVVDRDSKGAPIYEYFDEDDMPTRKQYLELAYKVKGKLQPEINLNQQFNIEDMKIEIE